MADNNDEHPVFLKADDASCSAEQWEQVFNYFYALLYSPRLPEEPEVAIENTPQVQAIVRVILELRSILKKANKGVFDYDITVKGFVGGLLKSMQANFKHMAWLTRQVANGNFNQRMDFMGDLAAAFNSMTDQLAKMLNELKEKQESLEQLTEDLQHEVEVRKHTEEKLRDEEERWELAAQCSRDGIWDVDLENMAPPYYSRRLSELVGFPPGDFHDFGSWERLFNPDDHELLKLYHTFLDTPSDAPNSFSIEHKLLCASGKYRWFKTNGMLIRNPQGGMPMRLIGVTADIEERKEREERYAYRATHDFLTDLPNRAFFDDYMKNRIEFARRNGSHLAVIMADLDNFKSVNDTYGHHIGDELLVEVASRLQENIRESDMVSRFGGDEFAVIFAFDKDEWHGVTKMLKRAMNALQKPIIIQSLNGRQLTITASWGVSVSPDDGTDPQDLLIQADDAMYYAKLLGRNCCAFWKPDKKYTLMKFDKLPQQND